MKPKRAFADPHAGGALSAAGAAWPVKTLNPADQRLLVVDDDASVREMLSRVLIGEGYSVSAAADGRAALEAAAATKFDLVLLDLNLPGENGWEIFESLIARDPLLAVIIVTARSNQLFTALGAGVGALLEKPLDFTELVKTVSTLLAETAETRQTRLAGHPTEFHHSHGQPPATQLKKKWNKI